MVPQAKILELLIKHELIRQEEAERAQKEATRVGQPLESVLVKSGYVTEEDIANIKAAVLGIPYIDLNSYRLDRSLVKLIPENIVKKYSIIPLFTTGNALSKGLQYLLPVPRFRRRDRQIP